MNSVARNTNDAAIAQRMMNVSRETLEKLRIYESLITRWQTIKNLVAPSTLAHLWTRHFADSVQLLKLEPRAVRWVDMGSGAGFPGLVIAICLADTKDALVHLIESDHRKCAFLREVARETGAKAIVHNERAEVVVDRIGEIDVVTARALTSLPKLIELCSPLLQAGARGLFLKGQDVESELTDDAIFSMVKLEFIQSQTSPESRIVRVDWAD